MTDSFGLAVRQQQRRHGSPGQEALTPHKRSFYDPFRPRLWPARLGGRGEEIRQAEECVALILYSDVRKGMVILYKGELCYVVDRELRTPGNLPSKLTLTL